MTVSLEDQTSVINLFNFVREIYDIKRPFNGNIENRYVSWDAIDPNLPGVTKWPDLNSDPNLLCIVERLPHPARPVPAPELSEWMLHRNGDQISFRESLEFKEVDQDGNEVLTVEQFSDDPNRVRLASVYQYELDAWHEQVRIIKRNNDIFDQLHTYWAEVEASNLKKEMALGNFLFDSSNYQERNNIKFPILSSPVTVEILADKSLKLAVRLNPEEKTVVHNEIFVAFDNENLNSQEFDSLKTVINGSNCNIVNTDDFEKIFSTRSVLLSTKCRWRSSVKEKRKEEGVFFEIYPLPCFFVQTKPTGLKEAVGSIIDKIQETGEIPSHLVEIASPHAYPTIAPESDEEPSLEKKLAQTAGEDPDILLTKLANAEQLTIAADLERNDVLLVQGPPGTGKTHTIANLMGHFLAQGKRILVTSEKVKALSVLKDKLPEEIKPLCVSRLGSQKDLLSTANDLQDKLARLSAAKLRRNISEQEQTRSLLIDDLASTRKQIFTLRQKDCETITYNGMGYSFVELAKRVREGESEFSSAIPGAVTKGAPCPSLEEVEEIYSTNNRWSPEEETELQADLPHSRDLPPPEECERMFNALHAEVARYADNEKDISESVMQGLDGTQLVQFKVQDNVLSIPKELRGKLLEIDRVGLDAVTNEDPVNQRMLAIGADDPAFVEKVSELIPLIDKINDARKALRVSDACVELNESIDADQVEEAATWFKENNPTGEISAWDRMRSKLIKTDSVKMEEGLIGALSNPKLPHTVEEFDTIILTCELIKHLNRLIAIWNRFVKADSLNPLQDRKDIFIEKLLNGRNEIEAAINWWNKVYKPFRERLSNMKISSSLLRETADLKPEERIRTAKAFINTLTRILIHEEFAKRKELFDAWHRKNIDKLAASSHNSSIVEKLQDSLLQLDHSSYAQAFNRLVAIESERVKYLQRSELLQKLELIAPDWANAIVLKHTGFDTNQMPKHIPEAWDWKQLELLYLELADQTIEGLQKRAALQAQRLRKCTEALAANKAWLAVKLRLEGSGDLLSALSRMATFMSKAAGTGKNVERNRQAAIELLPDCNRAIPAWIMTLDQAISSFGNAAYFDIIIVDEASQADITALPILFMSKKILIVGDDKQVTPDNVGTKIDKVNALIDQFLKGKVKSPNLFDTKMSLYGLIKANAFRTRMLVEHFRCVPAIIGFSNQLCYEGKIRPLRDKTDSSLLPAIVPWRVDIPNYEFGDFNQYEADAAINLINAMLKQPEYKNKTFGLISMRSSKGEIDRLRNLVTERIDPQAIETHDIICGSSAEFQGDERDVILMLLCDAPAPGQLVRLMRPEANEDAVMKRYNVAVSRAKDQLWVLHSFDPASQLQHDDIRALLFNWIKISSSTDCDEARIRNLADSEFEIAVAKALLERGYKIEQQHEVGSFRLDIVVHGKNDSVALECDGERFHSSDDAIRRDMERQAILERNGWRFIRIRGGEYYRDPQKTIERVCRELSEKNVLPNLESIEVEPTNLLDRVKSALPMADRSDNNAPPESVAEESVAETTDPQPKEESTAPFEKQSESEAPCIVAPQKPIEAAINAATDARPQNGGNPVSAEATAPKSDSENTASWEKQPENKAPCIVAPQKPVEAEINAATPDDRPQDGSKSVSNEATAPKSDSASAQPDNGTLFPDIEKPKSEEPPSLPKTKAAVSKPRTTVKTAEKSSRSKKTDAVKKAAQPDMRSSPVPTQAYSTCPDLTESDKNRILAEEAVIWSELKDLGCILIDKRDNGGALWVVPPEGRESIVKKTMFSLAKRFKLSFQWSPNGGRATKHNPAWFIKISRRC